MAESKDSKSLDSARLALSHTLLFESGNTSLGFFGVVDCVIDLDSKKLDSVTLDSESARDSVFSYKFARQTWYRGLG